MGFISRKILPACGNMCVCCPALRPSSRRPVKRYKKLLAEIFPKTIDGPPNERKITKLCEYAAKNPHRIPKIAKFLEQRCYKELRTENINFIKIITEIYCKLLYVCKDQMAYFASSLLNAIVELLNHKKQEAVQILGCQTLTSFIYSQADSTYAHNIEILVQKVCMLACEEGDEHRRHLRAASLQCLSAMVWFMAEYSHIFTDFDEIIHAILQNYAIEEHIEDNQRRETHHNWVDEVVRSEVRLVGNAGTDVIQCTTPIMPRPETMDSSKLTSEERQSPEIWSHICIQKLAELAKESTTMRRVLEPMISYFDNGRHWAAGHGLALRVLSVMSYLVKSPGNEQMILAAIIRHLDHKNVVHDPRIKSDIVQIATCLVRQLKSRSGIAEIAVASDLLRHLRKSLQATMDSLGPLESNWNEALQNSIEDCLLEIAKGIGDAYPLFDMMAITLEKLPAAATVARATIESLLIVAHIISSTSVNSHPQLVFPEALLLQLIKTMMHPDVETRVGAHQIFSVILVRSATYPRHGYEHRKWQSKSTSAFASATALFEKLRREKECFNADKLENYSNDDISIKDMIEEEAKNGRSRKTSPYFHKLSSVIDRTAVSTCPAEAESNIITLNEDQTAQLLSALWLQANQPDNLPSNFETVAHSFSLTLLSSRLKNSNHCNTVRFFQLPLSLLKVSLEPKGILRPSCQRSLLTLASGMLAFAGKIYQMTDLSNALNFLISSNVDPYLRIGNDLQIYIMPQLDLKDFGSETDQQSAKSLLADFRKMMGESSQYLLDIIVRDLSKLTNLEKDELAQQLSETFTPEYGPLCSSIPARDWDSLQAFGPSEESLSLDEESSRTSSVDGDIISESTAPDLPRFISRIPTKPPLSPVIGIGKLLESALHVAGQVAGTSVSTSPLPYGAMASQCDALGMGMRKKLSTWLVDGHDSVPGVPLPDLHVSSQSGIAKMARYGSEKKVSDQLQALRLPPASPFDNFMRAAGC